MEVVLTKLLSLAPILPIRIGTAEKAGVMATEYIQELDPIEEAERQAQREARRKKMLLLWLLANGVWILLVLGAIIYFYLHST